MCPLGEKGHHLLRGVKAMRFKFIEDNHRMLPIEGLYQILNVSLRGYRAYRCRSIRQRQREDMILLAHIRE